MMTLSLLAPPAMVSVLRPLSLAALLTAASPPALSEPVSGAPVPAGVYQAGGLGRLELSTQAERVSGVTLEPGACQFDRHRRVLHGVLQGQVLVGTLTLCLEGTTPQGQACPSPWRQPVLAFFSHKDLSLAARVRLPPGCSSPVLQGALLQLQQEPVASMRRGERPQPEPRRNPQAAQRALKVAQQQMDQNNWPQAALLFEESIEYDDSNWVTHYSLGFTRLMQKQARPAVEALEQALTLSPAPNLVSTIHYQLASAYSRLQDKERALQHLRESVQRGYTLPPATLPDEALEKLLGESPEFDKLVGATAGR